jgi:hypothetical protein
MSILKYYKVDSDGKIKRLRRECPNAECGAGVFVSVNLISACRAGLMIRLRWLSTKTVNIVASAT